MKIRREGSSRKVSERSGVGEGGRLFFLERKEVEKVEEEEEEEEEVEVVEEVEEEEEVEEVGVRGIFNSGNEREISSSSSIIFSSFNSFPLFFNPSSLSPNPISLSSNSPSLSPNSSLEEKWLLEEERREGEEITTTSLSFLFSIGEEEAVGEERGEERGEEGEVRRGEDSRGRVK